MVDSSLLWSTHFVLCAYANKTNGATTADAHVGAVGTTVLEHIVCSSPFVIQSIWFCNGITLHWDDNPIPSSHHGLINTCSYFLTSQPSIIYWIYCVPTLGVVRQQSARLDTGRLAHPTSAAMHVDNQLPSCFTASFSASIALAPLQREQYTSHQHKAPPFDHL